MDKDYLTLKRASASRPSGEWSDDDYDVLCEGAIAGRILKVLFTILFVFTLAACERKEVASQEELAGFHMRTCCGHARNAQNYKSLIP